MVRRVLSIAALLVPSALCAPKGANIFASRPGYINPTFQQNIDKTAQSANAHIKTTLTDIRGESSAYWLDVKAKVQPGSTALTTLEGILKDAAKQADPPVCTFIVYDLPNRDCHAHASNGEICCTYKDDGRCDYTAPGDCSEGIADYKEHYIDPLVQVLAKYENTVPIAVVIEPDSLPNLATNVGDPRCGSDATKTAYLAGVEYAVSQISSKAPKVTIYMDAAHGGWLGWLNTLSDWLSILDKLNVAGKIRGFATNTANYQATGAMCPQYDWCLGGKHTDDDCCMDPCKLASQYNAGNNEMNYALLLHNFTTTKWPGFEPRFILDTGRNGQVDMRDSCSNWCNVRNAGVGQRPTANTGSKLHDAFLWLKTPGESDGCTETLPSGSQCPRYDTMCGSQDSLGSRAGEPHAPEAGLWFDFQIEQLAQNAVLDP